MVALAHKDGLQSTANADANAGEDIDSCHRPSRDHVVSLDEVALKKYEKQSSTMMDGHLYHQGPRPQRNARSSEPDAPVQALYGVLQNTQDQANYQGTQLQLLKNLYLQTWFRGKQMLLEMQYHQSQQQKHRAEFIQGLNPSGRAQFYGDLVRHSEQQQKLAIVEQPIPKAPLTKRVLTHQRNRHVENEEQQKEREERKKAREQLRQQRESRFQHRQRKKETKYKGNANVDQQISDRPSYLPHQHTHSPSVIPKFQIHARDGNTPHRGSSHDLQNKPILMNHHDKENAQQRHWGPTSIRGLYGRISVLSNAYLLQLSNDRLRKQKVRTDKELLLRSQGELDRISLNFQSQILTMKATASSESGRIKRRMDLDQSPARSTSGSSYQEELRLDEYEPRTMFPRPDKELVSHQSVSWIPKKTLWQKHIHHRPEGRPRRQQNLTRQHKDFRYEMRLDRVIGTHESTRWGPKAIWPQKTTAAPGSIRKQQHFVQKEHYSKEFVPSNLLPYSAPGLFHAINIKYAADDPPRIFRAQLTQRPLRDTAVSQRVQKYAQIQRDEPPTRQGQREQSKTHQRASSTRDNPQRQVKQRKDHHERRSESAFALSYLWSTGHSSFSSNLVKSRRQDQPQEQRQIERRMDPGVAKGEALERWTSGSSYEEDYELQKLDTPKSNQQRQKAPHDPLFDVNVQQHGPPWVPEKILKTVRAHRHPQQAQSRNTSQHRQREMQSTAAHSVIWQQTKGSSTEAKLQEPFKVEFTGYSVPNIYRVVRKIRQPTRKEQEPLQSKQLETARQIAQKYKDLHSITLPQKRAAEQQMWEPFRVKLSKSHEQHNRQVEQQAQEPRYNKRKRGQAKEVQRSRKVTDDSARHHRRSEEEFSKTTPPKHVDTRTYLQPKKGRGMNSKGQGRAQERSLGQRGRGRKGRVEGRGKGRAHYSIHEQRRVHHLVQKKAGGQPIDRFQGYNIQKSEDFSSQTAETRLRRIGDIWQQFPEQRESPKSHQSHEHLGNHEHHGSDCPIKNSVEGERWLLFLPHPNNPWCEPKSPSMPHHYKLTHNLHKDFHERREEPALPWDYEGENNEREKLDMAMNNLQKGVQPRSTSGSSYEEEISIDRFDFSRLHLGSDPQVAPQVHKWVVGSKDPRWVLQHVRARQRHSRPGPRSRFKQTQNQPLSSNREAYLLRWQGADRPTEGYILLPNRRIRHFGPKHGLSEQYDRPNLPRPTVSQNDPKAGTNFFFHSNDQPQFFRLRYQRRPLGREDRSPQRNPQWSPTVQHSTKMDKSPQIPTEQPGAQQRLPFFRLKRSDQRSQVIQKDSSSPMKNNQSENVQRRAYSDQIHVSTAQKDTPAIQHQSIRWTNPFKQHARNKNGEKFVWPPMHTVIFQGKDGRRSYVELPAQDLIKRPTLPSKIEVQQQMQQKRFVILKDKNGLPKNYIFPQMSGGGQRLRRCTE